MLQIFVQGDNTQGFLDLDTNTTLDQETVLPLFDEELDSSDFTLPIEIPWTEKNRRLLSYAERLQNLQNTKNFWTCDVYDEGWPELLNGKLTLLEKSGNQSYNAGSFSASISGTRGLFGSKIKDTNLRDIDLGGTIVYSTEARQFAQAVMAGTTVHTNKFAFAPVVIENYFDTAKNYNGEFLVHNTVNDIVQSGGSWTFARAKSTNPNLPTIPGTEEHIDYRTVPFFFMKYVLGKALEKAGFTATGDLWNDTAFNDIHIFNTTSLETYSTASFTDYGRTMIPNEHLPKMKLLDFIRATFSFFNVYPTFEGNYIYLNYRKKSGENKTVLDLNKRTTTIFGSKFRDSTEEKGYEIDYEWDPDDDYRSERVKEIDPAQIVGTVATLPELNIINIGRTFTTDDIVFVTAENMYYKVANALVSPVLWDAWSERLGSSKYKEGARKVTIGAGTLCNYVGFDEPNALYKKENKLASRQNGNYTTNKAVKVTKDFSLRFFYITKQLITGNTVPVSHNHNVLPSGGQILPWSLAIKGSQGLDEGFHHRWQLVNEANETVTMEFIADKKLLQDLQMHNTLQIQNVQYLPRKINRTIPLEGLIQIEMIPL